MNKTVLYLSYFCLYSIALLVIGKGSLRGSSTSRDYFLCERKVGLPLCVCTFTGTWVSAITILSFTGSVYEDGLAVLFYSVIPWFLGAFLLAMVAGRVYANDVVTLPELFRVRYGSRGLQAVYGLIFIGVYVFYLVAQYKGFGMVAAAVFDIPYPIGVGMVYLFIMYTTFGGYRSVVRTDMFNLILLIVSLSVIFMSITSKVGGVTELYELAGQVSGYAHPGVQEPIKAGELLALFGGRYTPLISLSMFWGWGLGLAANPQYVVRLLGAQDSRTARNTVLLSMVLLVGIYFALVHIGLGMRVLEPTLSTPETTDGIIIRLINNELYGPWSGFFLFSVIGACISTANSQLLLIASSLSYDVIRNLWPRPLHERQVVMWGRMAVLGGGTFAMLLTLNPPAFTLSYGGDLWGVIGVLLFPPLYGTLLSKKLTRRGVWACLIVGGLAIAVFYPAYYGGNIAAHPAMFAMPLSTVAMVLVSWLDHRKGGSV